MTYAYYKWQLAATYVNGRRLVYQLGLEGSLNGEVSLVSRAGHVRSDGSVHWSLLEIAFWLLACEAVAFDASAN